MREHIREKHPEVLVKEGGIIKIEGKIYKKKNGKLVEAALCYRCGQYKEVSSMSFQKLIISEPNRGIFEGTPFGNILPTTSIRTIGICSDCINQVVAPSERRLAQSERVSKERIKREKGYLYYVGKDGYVWRIPMKQNPNVNKERAGKERINIEKGYIYFLDKEGYVARQKN